MTNDSGASLLRDLADRAEIERLVLRLYAAQDDGDWAALDAVYTPDVQLTVPLGVVSGIDAARALAERRGGAYTRMQHVNTDLLIDLDGDRATVRFNHMGFHRHADGVDAPRYDAGNVGRFEAVRTDAGWRLSAGSADIVWTAGEAAALR